MSTPLAIGTGATALRPSHHLLRRRARRAAARWHRQAPGNLAAVTKLERGPWRWRVDYYFRTAGGRA